MARTAISSYVDADLKEKAMSILKLKKKHLSDAIDETFEKIIRENKQEVVSV